MTTQIPTHNIYNTATPGFEVASGDGLLVNFGILISSTQADGILLDNGALGLTINGSVTGALDGVTANSGSTIQIGSTGGVYSNGTGMLLTDRALTNHGAVSGSTYGVQVHGVQNLAIINSGLIQAGDSGFSAISFFNSGTTTITNSGVIQELAGSSYYALDEETGGGIQLVTNTGTIVGRILLGAGADKYDGHAGHHSGGTIDMGAGNDIVYGGSDADNINGGADSDAIHGGLGNDLLTGGFGNDRFYFDTTLSASTNVDTITDFSHGVDHIDVDNAVMTAIGNVMVSGKFYAASGATHGHDADDRIVYDTHSGALYYDRDGNGSAAAVEFAVLGTSTHPTISYADFTIV